MPSVYSSRIPLIVSLAFVTIICPHLLSQATDNLQPLPNHSPASFAAAENRWRLGAVDFKSQSDDVAPEIRAARNKFWQPILLDRRQMEVGSKTVTEFEGPPSVNEVGVNPDAVWVIATFDHFSVESIDPDFNLLYTEMNFKVDEVIRQPKTVSLSSGMSFDVDIAGGRIKTPKGDIVAWQVTPRRYFVQPKHTYLMQVLPQAEGKLYVIAKKWDVSTGKVIPDQSDEISRAAGGHSKLNGVSVQDAVSYIQSVLPPDSSQVQ